MKQTVEINGFCRKTHETLLKLVKTSAIIRKYVPTKSNTSVKHMKISPDEKTISTGEKTNI